MRVLPLFAVVALVATVFASIPLASATTNPCASDGIGFASDSDGHQYAYVCQGGKITYESLPDGGNYCVTKVPVGCVPIQHQFVALP